MSSTGDQNRFGAGLVLLAAFALGILAGAALLHMVQLTMHRPPPHMGPPHPPGGPRPGGPPPPPGGPPPLAHLERELDLDAKQVAQLREILSDSRKRMNAEVESTGQRIREILTPEQRERFDEMRPPRPRHFPGPPEHP